MTQRAVRDVMTSDVEVAYVGTTAKTVADRLAALGVSALPVLDDEARVVGVVSEADLLHKITYQDDTDEWPRFLRRHRVDRAKAGATDAGQLMTAPAVTIGPAASVTEAARLMDRRGLRRLPVVDDDGKLAGIVSRHDLVRLFARSDDEIRTEIQTRIFARPLLLPPNNVAVLVTDGVVTLSGALPRKSDVGIALELTRHTDGVVEVVDELRYVDDDDEYRAVRHEPGQPEGRYF